MKRAIINGLEFVCATLDAIPSWERGDDGWGVFTGCWGCRIGITRWAYNLDQHWETGVWKP